MLLMNQRLDKLTAAHTDFAACGMLKGPLLTSGLANNPCADISSNLAHNANSDGDVEAVAGITSMGDVQLAQNPGK
jgi:hypothetical protein